MPSQSVRSSRSASKPKLRLGSGIRTDRLGRVALLLGVVLIVGFYLSSGIKLVIAHYQRVDTAAQVQTLQAEHNALVAQRKGLSGQQGIATEARRLGMVMPGEVPYVVTGLPGDRH